MAIIDDYEPRPGDFFLAKSDGLRGFVFRMAQVLTGEPSEYSHAGVVLDNREYIEACPGGAAIKPLETLWERRALGFSQNKLSKDERRKIVQIARTFEGTPYSWLHFMVLAGKTLHLKPKRIEERVVASNGMICSQLVDEIYSRAGVHLFTDGRKPGDVSPGSLAHVGRIYHCRREPRSQLVFPPLEAA